MSRQFFQYSCLLLLCFTAPAGAETTSPWRWQGDLPAGQGLKIELIRGEVRIERIPEGPVTLEAVVRTGDATASVPRLDVQQGPKGARLVDRYPARAPFSMMRECLPIDLEHGDFWASDARIELTVRAPEAVPVDIRIADRH